MEWNNILNQVLSILIPSLATLIAGWFAVLGARLKKSYQEKVNTDTAKAVVSDVVQFVQQVYDDLDGKAKFKKAIEQASAILQNKGINITETEITMLIESAVYGLKEGFNKEDVTKMIDEAIQKDREQQYQMLKEIQISDNVKDTVEQIGTVLVDNLINNTEETIDEEVIEKNNTDNVG